MRSLLSCARDVVTRLAPVALVLALLVPAPTPSLAAGADGVIGGVVFTDTNRDGVRQADEPALPDHLLYLYDGAGAYHGNTRSAADGTYAFPGLSDGGYTVRYAPGAWRDVREQWVPTTTGSLQPEHVVTVSSGATVADFGWRALVTSDDLAAPVSEVTGPTGLRVQSYNDAVTADEIHDHVSREFALGAEASGITVRFAFGTNNTNSTTVMRSGGEVISVRSTSYSSYSRWLDTGDRTMAHEYGHAWSNFHMNVGFDDNWQALLEARGVDPEDERIGSSHTWMPGEIAAEDYRQLFASDNARSGGQMNTSIPRPGDVEGYAAWLAGTFGGVEASTAEPTEPEPEPTDPEPTDPAPEPEPTDPEPDPEPTDPEPTDPEPTDPEPTDPADVELQVTTSKVKGQNIASLAWAGASGTTVEVRVDGVAARVPNSGSYTHETGARGNPRFDYQVCDADLCSELVVVDSW